MQKTRFTRARKESEKMWAVAWSDRAAAGLFALVQMWEASLPHQGQGRCSLMLARQQGPGVKETWRCSWIFLTSRDHEAEAQDPQNG